VKFTSIILQPQHLQMSCLGEWPYTAHELQNRPESLVQCVLCVTNISWTCSDLMTEVREIMGCYNTTVRERIK